LITRPQAEEIGVDYNKIFAPTGDIRQPGIAWPWCESGSQWVYNRDELLNFVVGIESQFYPQIGTLYERRIETWAAWRREALGLHTPEEDLEAVVGAGREPRHA
jgi:hypothetical protein